MRIQDFLGRGAAVKGLCEAFLSGAPIHAALITGPFGIGKRTLSALLVRSLFCIGEEKPCGVCPACRRFLAGSHPDAYHVTEKKSIGVDEVRTLTTALQRAPYEGGYRAVRIDGAGAMTVQAQNSLLKTLEEPPPQTVFLLTAVAESQLLPTIRSRCRIVRMPPMADAQVETVLRSRGVDAGRAAQLTALSGGSVGQALAMDADEQFWPLAQRVGQAVERAVDSSDVWTAIDLLKDDKASAQRVADLLEQALREALRIALECADTPSASTSALSRLDPRALTRLLGRLIDLRRMLASNVPWQAALERFLFYLSEESKVCRS